MTLLRRGLSLRLKLTLGYALVFVLASVAGALLIYLVASAALTRSLDVTLEETASVTVGSLKPGGAGFETLPRRRTELGLELLNARGQVTARAGEQPALNLQSVQVGLQTASEWRIYTVPLAGGGWLRVMRPTELLDGLLETLARTLMVAALLMIALSCLGGYLLADRALRPIDRVAQAAASIAGRASYRERVPVAPGNDELTRLTRTVNAMLDRLQGTIEREQGFARMAAHELRTPLTALAGRVELLLDEVQTAAGYQQGLVQIQERVSALLTLSEDLLRLARSEAPAVLEPVELSGAVLGPVEDLRAQVRAAGKHLRLQLDESWVRAEPEGVRQVASNLLQNALKYGGDELTLIVCAGELAVSDSGAGPDPAEWARLLRPLERGHAIGQRGTSGSGLGLAVVTALATRWSATLTPEWTPQGFRLTVRWPGETR